MFCRDINNILNKGWKIRNSCSFMPEVVWQVKLYLKAYMPSASQFTCVINKAKGSSQVTIWLKSLVFDCGASGEPEVDN